MIAGLKADTVQLVFRYLIVGGVTFCSYFALLYCGFGIFHASYPTAVAIAYFGALAVHFLANRSFTFRRADGAMSGQLLRYIATALINYLIQLLVIYLLYERAGFGFYVATLVAVCTNLAVGFLLQLHWVFSRK